RLALGLQDGGGAGALGAQDAALLLTFGGEDLRLALALGGEDGGALVTLGPHLLLHRVLDGLRRVDRLDLDPVDPDAPLAGGLVEDAAQLAVDGVAGGERALQVHRADDVPQRGHGQLLDGLDVVGDLVGGRARVGDLEVEHGVDLDDQVVLGDHRLRAQGDDLLTQVDHRVDAVDVRDDEVQPGFERTVITAEPFHVARSRLGHDAHRSQHGEHREQYDEDPYQQQRIHIFYSRG